MVVKVEIAVLAFTGWKKRSSYLIQSRTPSRNRNLKCPNSLRSLHLASHETRRPGNDGGVAGGGQD